MLNKTTVTDFYFRPYFTLWLAGSSKSGKSLFARDFITQWSHTMPNTSVTRFSLIYKAWQDSYDEIINSLPMTTLIETRMNLPSSNDDLETESETTDNNGRMTRPMCRIGVNPVDTGIHLCLIDDVLVGQSKNEFLTSLFTVFSHHYHVCVILVSQEIYNHTMLNRTLIRNTDQVVLLKSSVAHTTLRALQSQFFGGQKNFLNLAYTKILTKGGNYINIDLTPSCDDSRRVKHGLLLNEVR